MTWALWIACACASALAICFVLGRRHAPADLEAWCKKLSDESVRLQAALELQVAADAAMAQDAMHRAEEARDGLAYSEAIRLVDVAYKVLEAATQDRVTRLKGMSVCVRMASAAAAPVPPLRPARFRLLELRSLALASTIAHHLLVSAAERLLLKLLMLRFGCRLALRAMKGGSDRIHVDPAAATAWARCDAAVSDWTDGLDPDHVEAFRAVVATAAARQTAA
jgi:hypothetical protein